MKSRLSEQVHVLSSDMLAMPTLDVNPKIIIHEIFFFIFHNCIKLKAQISTSYYVDKRTTDFQLETLTCIQNLFVASLTISLASHSGVCSVFAHLELQNTRSPFSIGATALAQITKCKVRDGGF